MTQLFLALALVITSVTIPIAAVGPHHHPASATPAPLIIEQNPTLTNCAGGGDPVANPRYVDLSFGGAVSIVIDWGDGTQTTANAAGLFPHTYADTSAHTITVTGSFESMGQFQYSGEGRMCLAGVTQWGDTGVTALFESFQRWNNLQFIPANLPSTVTDTRYLFANRDFTAQMNTAIATWNTTNVTQMGYMFSNNNFAGDISGWNVSNVTMLKALFGSTGTSSYSLFNQSLASWNLRDGVDMSTGFGCPPQWSTANWTASLVGWASDQTPAHNVQLDACGKQWYDSAQSARDYLVNTLGWTITNDGGSVPSPPTSSTSTTSTTSTTAPPSSTSSTVTSLPTAPISSGLAPGAAKALVNGQLVDVTVTTDASGARVLSVAGQTFVVPADSFIPGAQFTLSGDGALAGSSVTVQLFSTPQLLGTLPVGNSGTFSGSASIPSSTPSGTHTLQMVSTSANGTPVIVELGVSIQSSSALPSTGATVWPAFIGMMLLLCGALGVLARRRFTALT